MSRVSWLRAKPILVAVTPDEPGLRPALPRIVAGVIRAGFSAVMFREKSLDDESFATLGRECRIAAQAEGGAFILNERTRLAPRIGPDAVHLTHRNDPTDIPHRDRFIVGASAHSPMEARAHFDGGCDYVVLGPIHETPSKRGIIAPLGTDVLRAASREAIGVVLAIGGVDQHSLPAVLEAGARGACMIRSVFGGSNPEEAATELVRTARSWREQR